MTMQFINTARLARRGLVAAATTAAIITSAACNDTSAPITTPMADRSFNQVQRLGNPLVSEVFVAKKDHPLHGSVGPDADVALFTGYVKGFIATFRPKATVLQNTVASVLLPDMLIIQTDKDPSTAGWLSWALTNGYGGRKLTDDVVDITLTAGFSDLLDPTQAFCKPGQLPLCTDNIGPHSQFSAAFPYLPAAK